MTHTPKKARTKAIKLLRKLQAKDRKTKAAIKADKAKLEAIQKG